MRDSVRNILNKVSPKRDWVDEVFIKEAEKYMIHFNLISFQVSYPSLYATIRESIKAARQSPISDN